MFSVQWGIRSNDVSQAYLNKLEQKRSDFAKRNRASSGSDMTKSTEDEDVLELHNAG